MTHPRATALLAFVLAAALLPCQAGAAEGADQHGHGWTYEGAAGPAHWGELKSEYAGCALGQRQSPIDIKDTVKEALPPIDFAYRSAPLRVIDNGHTVQVNFDAGSAITVGGARYELLQFHVHTPSEERVGGKAYPMVAHLVHRNAEGKLAVVAVLFEQGKENALLQQVFAHIPAHKGEEVRVDQVSIALAGMLPREQGYYSFAGSLTTPPCSEDVSWMVLRSPVEMSATQLQTLRALYPNNARPPQALNGRVVKESL
ncbi:MAG: carbonic anhydrase family protein [Pseudomonadota bacterium]